MRILLLGGTGFIGSHVASRLLAGGHIVAIIHRGRTPVPPGCVAFVSDRADAPALHRAVASFAPDTLVDLIAYSPGDADQLLAVLSSAIPRLVVLSSGDVYATYGAFLGHEPPPRNLGPVPETGPLRTHHFPYRAQASSSSDFRHDYEKILVEERFRTAAPMPVTVLRLPMVYGPGDLQQRVLVDLRRLRESPGGLTLHPDESNWRCTRGYVADVAAAIALAATHPRAVGQTYNVGEADAWTQHAWLAALAREVRWTGTIRADLAGVPSRPARWTVPLVIATDRIRRELGYVEPVGRSLGLHRSVLAAASC